VALAARRLPRAVCPAPFASRRLPRAACRAPLAAWKDPTLVVIAGPNLTIDRTLRIDELRPGEVLRFEDVVVTPGGKGVNVARLARSLGADALLLAFVPGRTGEAAAGLLADEGVALHGVPVGGEVRSTAVVLERSGRVTVFNEPGPALGRADWERYQAVVAQALEGQRVLACSGSLPPGAPPDAYARLVAVARGRGAVAIVDVGGPQLAAAVAGGADLVTPNLAEAEGLLHGRADETVEAGDPAVVRSRALAAARALVDRGAVCAVVTAAAAGAAVADGDGERWLAAPAVAAVRNPVGAGDALVGGLAVALERGDALADAVAFGVAAGSASVETDTAGVAVAERVAELRGAV
jgi:1-phosphofructokinase family hexose kinase